jgi:hypothetical protein
LVDTLFALSRELCFMAIDRYTISEADRNAFSESSQSHPGSRKSKN